jgi:hypothetical protein
VSPPASLAKGKGEDKRVSGEGEDKGHTDKTRYWGGVIGSGGGTVAGKEWNHRGGQRGAGMRVQRHALEMGRPTRLWAKMGEASLL